MQSFTYYSPTKVIFGKGAEEKTAQEVLAFGAAAHCWAMVAAAW